MRLLVATSNEGKAHEIRQLLSTRADGDWEILCFADLAYLWQKEALGGLPPLSGDEESVAEALCARYAQLKALTEETGTSFEENAVIKARGAAQYTGLLSMADDSGLEVAYLQGAPGVYSARYAGPEGDDEARNALLLRQMQHVPAEERDARFVSVIALASPEGGLFIAEGVCEGRIGFAAKGSGGFGYDPLFILPNGETMAELTMDEKNKVSHRGKALEKMIHRLKAQALTIREER